MLFPSFEYVLFLWSVYVVFWTLRNRRSLGLSFVLLASYWFYAQADWRFTSLLFTSTVVDWICGKRIHAAHRRGEGKRWPRFWLTVSLVSNLGMLGFFKYYDFFVDSVEDAVGLWGASLDLWHLSAAKGGPLDYVVPAGISFYTFQTLSYTIDIYYKRIRPAESHLDFAVYVAFFPQLVAGPIVRARDFLPQLRKRTALTHERISSGLFQILRGMTKKLVVADVLGAHIVDLVYRDSETLAAAGAPTVILATVAFTMQLYGDFSGYTDIAIGSARLLGFELRKNFDAPFKSRSLEEFWTRWHISMSFWFYYYVFNALGGNRKGFGRLLVNLFLTHFLSGLWHGAAWSFVIWGAWFGVWMVIVRVVRRFLPDGRTPDRPLFDALGWMFTAFVCISSLLFFRAPSFDALVTAVVALGDWSKPLMSVPWQVWTVFGLAWAAHFMPEGWLERMERGFTLVPRPLQGAALAGAAVAFLGIAPPGLAPFIYFQF